MKQATLYSERFGPYAHLFIHMMGVYLDRYRSKHPIDHDYSHLMQEQEYKSWFSDISNRYSFIPRINPADLIHPNPIIRYVAGAIRSERSNMSSETDT